MGETGPLVPVFDKPQNTFGVIYVRNEPRLDEESLSEDFLLVAMEEGSDEGGGEERFGYND